MPHDDSDGTYARRVQEGSEARRAFQILVERYEGMVFDLAHQYADTPEDAEDLAQDIFLKAYRKIETLRTPEKFASWLYGLALNRCRDYAKNVRRETHPFSRSGHEEVADVPARPERDRRACTAGAPTADGRRVHHLGRLTGRLRDG